MPRKRRKYKHRPGKYRGGQVIVNKKDYTRRDHISPGRLVAWAEWIPNERRQHSGTDISVPATK
ncbi:MAG: hypothetical protein M0P69_15140 [Bacteroidales bacterium]|nr:hypothetical protein [Bacteroidales bacterium]